MTTTTRTDAVLAPADGGATAPAEPTSETTPETTPAKTPAKTQEKKRHWAIPVVVGAVAFGAGAAVGSSLTWRFSVWWKPS
ncbi:hypothetical protein GCM10009817_06660 [Terrabacter lapilli]|uniref:Uncharacterized protein n=1 Tax=Terrabacter lapilli TaxID=436231 RepID=A0ABN2RIK7_9MICO